MTSQLGIIQELGFQINRDSVILDLGCGSGNLINEYRKNGYQAYGCDFDFRPDVIASFAEHGIIKKISTDKYRLPFESDSIDFVFSDQVFEHVIDYPETLSEIKRILKPNGFSLHFFPSRYKIIEVHVNVPFSSVIKNKFWLTLWAYLGVRNNYQKGISARNVATLNHEFLNTRTNYLTRSQIKNYCKLYFRDVRFCEKNFFKHVQRTPYLYRLSNIFPLVPLIYSELHSRVLFFTNKTENVEEEMEIDQ